MQFTVYFVSEASGKWYTIWRYSLFEINVFKILKYIIYIVIIAAIAGYFWALPKLDFIKKNPGFCTQLTHNLYYCGDKADAKQMFEANK